MFRFLISFIISLSIMFTTVSAKEVNIPKIYGEAYVVMDGNTNEVIISKNADVKMYPASITKLITAILLAEHKEPGDTLIFTQKAKEMPEYSVNLNYYPMQVGQELSADFVMKSILTFSANDMAQVVADNLSEELGKPFEEIMNQKLKEIGIHNTHFKNPVGLHNDEHYSTAYDLALLLKEALKYDWIKDVIGMKEITVTLPNGSIVVYENSNKLLGVDGMIGGKTGYTSRAGRTLVGAFERNGRLYIVTVLKSIYDSEDSYVFEDMKNLVNVAEDVEPKVVYKKGDVVGNDIPLKYKLFGFFGPEKVAQVDVMLKDDVLIYENDYNKKNISTEIIMNDGVNIFKDSDKDVGKFIVKIPEYTKSYNLCVNMTPIIMSNILIYVLVIVLIVVVIALILLIIRRFKKKRRVKRMF